jgi:hypothetical protein
VIPYITFREPDKQGNLQYYILQKQYPFFIGIIAVRPTERIIEVPIAGYNLWVAFDGTLMSGNMIPIERTIVETMQGEYENMAKWYLEHRILKDEKKFAKFKL